MKQLRLLSFIIAAVASMAAHALPVSGYPSQSAMATGRWVKLKVSTDGVYQISHSTLRALGFDNPEAVRVCGFCPAAIATHKFTVANPGDLPVVPVLRQDDRILFYAQADALHTVASADRVNTTRNLHDFSGCWFITDAPLDEPAPAPLNEEAATRATTHRAFHVYDPQDRLITSFGPLLYSEKLTNDGLTVTAPIDQLVVDPEYPEIRMTYDWVAKVEGECQLRMTPGSTVSQVSQTHALIKPNQGINSHNMYNIGRNGVVTYKSEAGVPRAMSVTFYPPVGTTVHYSYLDRVAFMYDRHNVLLDTVSSRRMDFTYIPRRVDITASRPLEAWDITTPGRTVRCVTAYDAEAGVTSLSPAGRTIVAFDPAATYPEPAIAGEVANQNLHGITDIPELVIIAVPSLMTSAKRIASIHRRYQDMDVLVVNQEQIFNEFSSGARSADGVRLFLKMLYDRKPAKLKHLLLMGPSANDMRHLIDPTEYLVSYQADIVEHHLCDPTAYVSDAFFGMLDDSFNVEKPHRGTVLLNVGRLAVSSETDAMAYADKIEKYLAAQSPEGYATEATITCSHGDGYSHLVQADEVADVILQEEPATTVNKLYNNLFYWPNANTLNSVHDALSRALSRGQGYFNYTGHAGPNNFSTITLNNVRDINFATSSVAMLATCKTFPFDTAPNNIVTSMVVNPGGFITAVASAREVYQNYNQYLNVSMAREYFKAGPDDYIGDIYRRAVANSPQGFSSIIEGLMLNNMSYNLAGDPALPARRPGGNVNLTEVNGSTPDGGTVTVAPLSPLTLRGTIVKRGTDEIDAAFNGSLIIKLYENADSTKIYKLAQYSPADWGTDSVYVDQSLLGRYRAEVVDGMWEATIVPPVPTKTAGPSRLQFFSLDKSGKRSAIGAAHSAIALAESPVGDLPADVTPPEILGVWINNTDFTDGMTVAADGITLLASVAPDASGLSFAERAVGAATTLTLDGGTSFPEVRTALRTEADGGASLQFSLPRLDEGMHTACLSVADNAGNRATRTISFRVGNPASGSISLLGDAIARHELQIGLDTSMAAPECTLMVEDILGNIVLRRPGCTFPYSWDLHDNDGTVLPDGAYRAYVMLSDGVNHTSTTKLPFTILAPR